jgi:hypothetical protein
VAKKFFGGVDVNNQRVLNVASPSTASDGVPKSYVDALLQGLSWKQAVRAATTANGTLATAYANASVIDGVTLATGDRILIKDQTTQSENGIYTVNAAGAPTRAADTDTGAELVNATVYVSLGTANADKAYTQTAGDAVAPPTIGTTSLVWALTGGGTTYTAGNGLQLASTTFSVLADPVAGGGISVAAAGVKVDTAVVVRKFAATIGDGATTAIAVVHNLGTKDVIWSLQDVATGAFYDTDAVATSTTTLTLTFPTAPASNSLRVVVHV